jgi:hypothetical protein
MSLYRSGQQLTFAAADGHDEPATGLNLANVEAWLTTFRNSRALSTEGRGEAGALDVPSDEGVADDIDGTDSALLAGVDAAVGAGGNSQAADGNFVFNGIGS